MVAVLYRCSPVNDNGSHDSEGNKQGISSLQIKKIILFLVMHVILDIDKFASCSTEEGSTRAF